DGVVHARHWDVLEAEGQGLRAERVGDEQQVGREGQPSPQRAHVEGHAGHGERGVFLEGGDHLVAVRAKRVDEMHVADVEDARGEAARWAETQRERLAEGATAVVLGLGLGYHVEALAAVWPGPIVVVEPDRAVWRTALAARDLRALLEGRVSVAVEDADRPVVL